MPDIALLSINTFQKDLNDGNPLIRFQIYNDRAMVLILLNEGSTRHVWDKSPFNSSVDRFSY
jgi:hypothetical protein